MKYINFLNSLSPEQKEYHYNRLSSKLQAHTNGVCLTWNAYDDINIKGHIIDVCRFFAWYHGFEIEPRSYYRPSCGTPKCLAKEHLSFFKHPSEKGPMLHYLQSRAVEKGECRILENVYTDEHGYGFINLHGKKECLHRVVFWCGQSMYDKLSEIPKDKVVGHLCRNKTCVLPEHYELISVATNCGAHRLRDGTDSRGEKSSFATITDEKAQAIMDSWSWMPKWTAKARAVYFGVSHALVRNIDCRKTWSHLIHPNGKPPHCPPKKPKMPDIDRDYTKDEIEMIRRKLKERSVEKESIHCSTNCWEWKKASKGAPKMGVAGKCRRAIRFAAIVSSGCYRHNLLAIHACGYTRCVNPDHISWGTPLQNARDKYKHGTVSKKLTIEDVKYIKASESSSMSLASRFKVSAACIGHIKNGSRWKHVVCDSRISDVENE